MGGHGGLNILPQKRWNVYRFDNREKVRQDEEAAAKEEQLKQEQSRKRDSEFRLEQLKIARGLPPAAQPGASVAPQSESESESKSNHINLFEGLKDFSSFGGAVEEEEEDVKKDRFKKKMKLKKEVVPKVVLPEDEKYRLGYGIAGKGVKAPWYLSRPSDDADAESGGNCAPSGSGKQEGGKNSGKKTLEQRNSSKEGLFPRLYDWLYGRKYLESLDPNLLPTNGVWFDEKTHTHQEYISTEEVVTLQTLSQQGNYIASNLRWIMEILVRTCVDSSSWFRRQEISVEMDFKTLNKTVKTGLDALSFKIETRFPDNLSEAIEHIIDLYYDTNLDTKLETLEQNLETKIGKLLDSHTGAVCSSQKLEFKFLNQNLDSRANKLDRRIDLLSDHLNKKLLSIQEAIGAREEEPSLVDPSRIVHNV
ncbi:hypothetical protein HHK36_028672 [Tetracentron sinense]|uniref:CBF1-interacting co-repressor CIR N-terminal domain-containing protein n=1 Tax=Tetracentron sinense TaxID=13715 RepID=A0A835D0T2_TETSI|nr:hypothetical protein HHK36_028672 [Tetracentron sinense]